MFTLLRNFSYFCFFVIAIAFSTNNLLNETQETDVPQIKRIVENMFDCTELNGLSKRSLM
jgi:hypothetical protein